MKRLPGAVIAVLISLTAYSQNYYNDIISTQLSNANYKLLKQSHISQVKGASFEGDESPTPNFKLQQELSRDKKKLTTTTTTSASITSITISYFQNERLRQTVDTIRGVKQVTDYTYDASGKLSKIISKSMDPEHSGNTVEENQWFYKADGSPDYMFKIKNKTDTVRVDFVYDEKGNLAEEHWKRKDRLIETWYYYYNDNKQLTDVVRYNSKTKQMLPDFTFDYDANGRISQMMQTLQGTSAYLLWKYTYNENGLKQKEVCYDKNRYMVGWIEYTYSR